ncbi:MAG: cation:proton antiporter [Clostridia bacterium]|nr:cation:proton antiporter [Clostridia bacterium]
MNLFVSLGIALIVGVACGKLMNRFKVPAVAGYIIGGLLLGASVFNIVSGDMINQLSFISDFALCIIAFNIGSELEIPVIKQLGKSIFIIAFFEAVGAFLLVSIASYLITHDPAISLILGSVSAATAPAATVMVLRELNAKGPLTSTLLGVVAVDDAICLIIFAMAASVAKVFVSHEVITVQKVLLLPIEEIVLSIVVGAIMGIVLSLLIKYAKGLNELLPFIIAALLILDGVATVFELSPLLSAMSMGVVVANVAPNKGKAFKALEDFAPPIVAAFFILAGARLNIAYIPQIGILGVAYLLFRILGKLTGAALGATISKAPATVKKYIGYGLLSQVGVAVGLAITVNREFPNSEIGTIVVTILLATTIATEIVGPIATKHAVVKSNEARL